MNAIVIEHVPVAELPAAWRARLASEPGGTVTVRIESERTGAPDAQAAVAEPLADNPLVGMWRDREDMADVAAYVRRLRSGRFDGDVFGKG